MIDITSAMIARIQQQCPVFNTVDTVSFLEAPGSFSSTTPAALVGLASDETVEDAPTTIQSSQQIIQSYAVWIIASESDLEQARIQVQQTLLGWQPTTTNSIQTDALHYKKGAVEHFSTDLIWWREYWALPVWVRQQ